MSEGTSRKGHENPIIDAVSLKRADCASDEAIETINRTLRGRNQGQVVKDDIELTLVLLFTKYFNALTAVGLSEAELRERFEAFQQALMMTFSASMLAASETEKPKRRCICHLSPSAGKICPHDALDVPGDQAHPFPMI